VPKKDHADDKTNLPRKFHLSRIVQTNMDLTQFD